MSTTSYDVAGMTCDHCARAVTTEVSAVPGVTSVQVDVTSGRVDVEGEAFTDAAIAEAVAEAGYSVT